MRLVVWSPLGLDDYEQNVAYLLEEWTVREAENFIDKVQKTIGLISLRPTMYPRLDNVGIEVRKAVITSQISMLYTFDDTNITLLSFWNNYQNPDRLKKRFG